MSTDLVSSITQVLSSSLVARITSSLGLDRTVAEKALQAGVPSLLAALTSLVSKPAARSAQSGYSSTTARRAVELGQRDRRLSQKSLIDTGTSTLTSLLGGSTTSVLTNAISQYAGIDDAGSKSLMGLLGPVVMGVLGQQQRASGLDATGLANLLASQKDNIARALPAGFSKYLGGTDILDSLVDSVDQRRPSAATASSGSSRPGYATSSTQRSSARSGASSSQFGWLIPALAAVAIGGLAWHWLSRPSLEETAVTPPPAKIELRVASGANSAAQEHRRAPVPAPASQASVRCPHPSRRSKICVASRWATSTSAHNLLAP